VRRLYKGYVDVKISIFSTIPKSKTIITLLPIFEIKCINLTRFISNKLPDKGMDTMLGGIPIEILISVITVIAGLISAILTYFLGVLKIKRELIVKFDQRVLEERLMAYKELWKLFLPLAKYNPSQSPTYGILKNISILMTKWYYETGGLYLTYESRKEYFDVQDKIQELLKKSSADSENLDEESKSAIFKKVSLLRTKLSGDIGSRKNLRGRIKNNKKM
jgi:hypothetical protein